MPLSQKLYYSHNNFILHLTHIQYIAINNCSNSLFHFIV